MIQIDKPKEPENSKIYKSGKERKGKTYQKVATENIIKDFEEGKEIETKIKETEHIYQHFKAELLEIQHNKCCYCESRLLEKSSHQKAGDVEHFRPKNGYKQDILAKEVSKSSYFWLAYDWDNLLFSCEVCNNKPYKENKFPLIDDSKRAKSHRNNLNLEEPYLINPAKEDPEQHFTFRKEFIFPKSVRASISIKILGLDRKGLNITRLEHLKTVETLAEFLDKVPENLKKEIEENIKEHKKSSAKFAGMIRANFPKI
ncbi:MAG: hypothetical protein EAZ97_14400 [Bacteroidetes bacterium]|nr:MAG: hypothetical protein EAZ97_14400 [Bacteroidota bacterium]